MRYLFLFIFLWIHPILFAQASLDSLRKFVVKISTPPYPRNTFRADYVQKTAEYIFNHFRQYAPHVSAQNIVWKDEPYENIVVRFGPSNAKRIIIGAHYDVFGNTQGADYNASGVAALMELARLFSMMQKQLLVRIDLVAYALHEPSNAKELCIGSKFHANSLLAEKNSVLGMLNLDGIGYFSDKRKSQRFPFWHYRILYGHRGNFIGIMQQHGNQLWSRQMRYLLKQYANKLRVINFKPGLPISFLSEGDHSSYWDNGFDAICLTNTGPWRNKNYRFDTDTYETLDYFRMTKVVNMVYHAILRYRV